MSKDPKPLWMDTLYLTDEKIDEILKSPEWPWYLGILYSLYIHCECGKDKHGFANHSIWCPKHE